MTHHWLQRMGREESGISARAKPENVANEKGGGGGSSKKRG